MRRKTKRTLEENQRVQEKARQCRREKSKVTIDERTLPWARAIAVLNETRR